MPINARKVSKVTYIVKLKLFLRSRCNERD